MSSALPAKSPSAYDMRGKLNELERTHEQMKKSISDTRKLRNEIQIVKNTIHEMSTNNSSTKEIADEVKYNMDYVYKELQRIDKMASAPSTALRKELNNYDSSIKDMRMRVETLENQYDLMVKRYESLQKQVERLNQKQARSTEESP